MSSVNSKAMALFEGVYAVCHADFYAVTCYKPIEGFLTEGQKYIVRDIIDSDPSRVLIEVMDDRGIIGHFKATRFMPL